MARLSEEELWARKAQRWNQRQADKAPLLAHAGLTPTTTGAELKARKEAMTAEFELWLLDRIQASQKKVAALRAELVRVAGEDLATRIEEAYSAQRWRPSGLEFWAEFYRRHVAFERSDGDPYTHKLAHGERERWGLLHA